MRLSTKSTYGLRAMLSIASRYKQRAVPISEISKREDISVSYLEQLLNRLRRRGLLRSVRGPGGGYVLSRSPGRIKVGDIVRILEGDTSPIYCVARQRQLKRACRRSPICRAKGVWQKLARAIDDVLDSVTLQDLRGEK